ncbi:MAG: xanthan lyase [Phycisphaerae bacterium]|nr:MAG: xanthan lyase [Phycisphaerae bacterium]
MIGAIQFPSNSTRGLVAACLLVFATVAMGQGKSQADGLNSIIGDQAKTTTRLRIHMRELEGLDDFVFLSGARVDQTEWIGNVCHLKLTIPSFAQESPDIVAVQELSESLVSSIKSDLDFGGVIVRVRTSETDDYRLLEDFVPVVGSGTYPPLQEDGAIRPGENAATPEQIEQLRSLGGPAANAGNQPAGALSGVVVYAAAGHGWTANAGSWGLQRPLLLDMVEDYGNLDQLNYFVNYLFNAGATVVAFRPVGYQEEEVVLDQDDPGVTYTGSWINSGSSPYYENGTTASGINYRFAVVNVTETATARYTPNLPTSDYYPVYTWVLDSNNRTTQLYRVTHSGGTTEVTVDHRMVGRGWVYLGSYYFEAGTDGYVEISNQSAAGGNVIADAIRFGNGIGDIVGAGPGTISGYPRDEEAQRYWAESEAGVNAVGMPTSIYNCCSSDNSDNISTAARWAREMNNTTFNIDRWRRIYLEFHSNASSGGARGTVALVTGNNTTNQTQYATILGDEVEQDMLILDSGFESNWAARSNPANGSFGAISTTANSNEFDATILEVAFHDNATDAALLLDPKVRDAVARSSVHGVIKFLNAQAGSTIPLAFLPTQPRNPRAIHDGSGGITLSWDTPLTGEAYGDAPTGYRVYRSSNGFGFDSGTDVGLVNSVTLNDVPPYTTTYFRIAAYNAGGESLPSITIGARARLNGPAKYLIVNGFDRVSRSQDPRQVLGGLGTQRRPILRYVNSFDYVVQHGDALADSGVDFDSCQNENIISGAVDLADYGAVLWICGEESSGDDTFNATEQALMTSYLNGGGKLFVSGAEIAWDLDNLGNGVAFYNNALKADYVGDDAGTYNVGVVGGSIFDGIGSFAFDDGSIYYDAEFPDRLGPIGGSSAALTYVGGSGGTAAVVFDGVSQVVNLGFPFETITSESSRSEIMGAVVEFFDVGLDLSDLASFIECMDGPDAGATLPDCGPFDFGVDSDVDLDDAQVFQILFAD